MKTFSFSTFPEQWNAILHAPVFIISMDIERYEICKNRAIRAGFVGEIKLFMGINRDNEEELQTEWAKHPFLPSHQLRGPHPTAVMLAHLNMWKHIVENNISYAVILEDDILFHTEWDKYVHMYYQSTPKDCDMIYMGHHCGNVYPNAHIVQVPVYCTNAYLVTYNGANKLYEMITNYTYETDFGVIDMMLVNIQREHILHKKYSDYHWYVWNTEMFPDPINEKYKHPESLNKDFGLIFQQYPFYKLKEEE